MLVCWWPPFLGAHQDYKGHRWLHDYSRDCKPLTATTFHSLVALGLSCLRCMGLTPRVRVWFLGGVAAGPGCCCCSHASCWQISLCTHRIFPGERPQQASYKQDRLPHQAMCSLLAIHSPPHTTAWASYTKSSWICLVAEKLPFLLLPTVRFVLQAGVLQHLQQFFVLPVCLAK